jgi:DUF971 family protein
MHVTRVKQTSPAELALTWDDGHEGRTTLRVLRDACPCAGCQGETVLFRSSVPEVPDINTPGRYELRGAQAVGNYALQFTWGDGHTEGIYIWDLLRSLCECPACLTRKGSQ